MCVAFLCSGSKAVEMGMNIRNDRNECCLMHPSKYFKWLWTNLNYVSDAIFSRLVVILVGESVSGANECDSLSDPCIKKSAGSNIQPDKK